jgi:inosose dehydratase
MSIRLGSAPDSWGVWFADDPRQTPWKRFLDEIAEVGYEWTELGPYGYLPTRLDTLRSELGRRGLKITGSAIIGRLEDPEAWNDLEREVLGAGELLGSLGARFLVLIDDFYTDIRSGKLIDAPALAPDPWKRLIETTHRVADLARKKFSLQLTFHPHAQTHVETEAQIEKLLEDTDPGRVSLCLDTGHHAYAGGDPVRFFKRHHERIPYLHLKSVDPALQKKVQSEGIPFSKAVEMGVFCDPSEGAVNCEALHDALRAVRYDGWLTVEQDMYPCPAEKPLPIARRTREYLRKIGMG